MGGVDTGDRLGDFVIRTTLSAMVGGSTSAAMGGRFADGAAAGARIMLMNEMGEDVIDFVIGFGDGVSYGKTVDLRDSLGTNESVNMDSSGYQLGESIGNIWGAATLALLGVRVLASTVPKNALINQNRYLRIGPGKISKTAGKSRFNYGAGRDIPMMRIGNKTPSDLNHLDLRILGR